MSLLVSDLRSCHFHAPSHVNSECTCAHLCAPGRVRLKVRFGEAHQWGIVILVDQQKAVPKESVSCYFKDSPSHCSYTLISDLRVCFQLFEQILCHI